MIIYVEDANSCVKDILKMPMYVRKWQFIEEEKNLGRKPQTFGMHFPITTFSFFFPL
jgi:hypothetical protein